MLDRQENYIHNVPMNVFKLWTKCSKRGKKNSLVFMQN